jgi:hypothetical protein
MTVHERWNIESEDSRAETINQIMFW